MATKRKHPGTPTYHSASARKGRQATYRVSRQNEPLKLKCIYPLGKCPIVARGIPAIMRDKESRLLRTGFMLGFAVAAALFGLILWLWVIPTMDAAVAAAQGAVA